MLVSFKSLIFLFFINNICSVGYSEIHRTISEHGTYIDYRIKSDQYIRFYNIKNDFSWNYFDKDFLLKVSQNKEGSLKYTVKFYKNNFAYNLFWIRRGLRNLAFKFSIENNPIYYSFGKGNKCDSSSLNKNNLFVKDLLISTSPSQSTKLNFDSNCDALVENWFPDYKQVISSNLISGLPLNDSTLIESIQNKLNHSENLSNAQAGFQNLNTHGDNKLRINCVNNVDCANEGSYDPKNSIITLNTSCKSENDLKSNKCKFMRILAEELLHHVTKIDNEPSNHNDVKLISKEMSKNICENNTSTEEGSVEIASTSDNDKAAFNGQVVPNLKPNQLPQPPPSSTDTVAKTFIVNPATTVTRTVTGPSVSRELASIEASLAPTIKWARKAMDIAVGLTQNSANAAIAANSRQTPKSLTSNKNANKAPLEPEQDASTTLNPSNSREIASVPQTNSEKSESTLSRLSGETSSGRNIASSSSPTSYSNARPLVTNSSTNSLPAKPLDASYATNRLPNEIFNAIQLPQIQSVNQLVSQLKNNALRPQLVKRLQDNNIQIVGLDNEPIGQLDRTKVKNIYRYAESRNSPRLIKVTTPPIRRNEI